MSLKSQPVFNPPHDVYQGPWNFTLASHLLRRTVYGPNEEMIRKSVSLGMNQTIDSLLEVLSMPDPPINPNKQDDIYVPIGKSWVGLPQPSGTAGYRRRSFYAWTMLQALKRDMNVREKMFMFWHNHFATADINDPRYLYSHSLVLRKNALGNFRSFVKEITVDPTMLRYLNGNQNTRQNPNENYARELLELFTIGKGPAVGEGDYTHYTEDDILAIAKVLTGWKEGRANKVDTGYLPVPIYRDNLHDRSTKKLSHRFQNLVINNLGKDEYQHLIDILFMQDEVSRFITRKLFRWFVNYEITEEIEKSVIEPLAQILRESDYEIRPLLRALFSHRIFYDETYIGGMIKSPIDVAVGNLNAFDLEIPEGHPNRMYNIGIMVYNECGAMQQRPFSPPDVAGWKAYYQEPGYYQAWINSTTLRARKNYCNLTVNGKFFNGDRTVTRNLLKVDVLEFAKSIEGGTDPNKLIEGFVNRLLPQSLAPEQILALKETLIPGLPDYEWTVEYSDYLANKGNQSHRLSIEVKLRHLLEAMNAMPESYLM